jgi:hypothetical protein
MRKSIMALTALIIAMLFLSSIGTTVFYYNTRIASLTEQISVQNREISDLNNQIANFSGTLAFLSNFTDANLIATLGVSEVGNTSHSMYTYPFYRLYIAGTIRNNGTGMALEAGLHVLASASDGTVKINMTVPLINNRDFGTDSATNAFVESWHTSNPSMELGSLGSGQSTTVSFNIFHEGVVSNWTVTPVWWSP